MVTLKDVAKKAGVSQASVSRVLSGSPYVSEEMAKRVLEAVDALGYVPNPAARALVLGKDLSVHGQGEGVGVLVASAALKFSHSFFSEILDAIDQELESYGKWIAYVKDSQEIRKNPRMMGLMSPKYVEGLVFMGDSVSFPFLEKIASSKLPIVLIGFSAAGLDSIIFDKENGIKELIDHLVGLGHRRLAYMGGNDERRSTFISYLQAKGLEVREDWLVHTPWTTEDGYKSAYRLFSKEGELPTAVIGGCDLICVGVVRGILDCGLRVPEDISVAGFDDINIAKYMVPRLTTARVHRKDIGQFAARRIIDQLNNQSEANMVARSPIKLIVRDSTGPCSS